MAEIKTFKVASLLNSEGTLLFGSPLPIESEIQVGINFLSHDIEINHCKIKSGELFVISSNDLVLSVNTKGELICICEENVIPSINNEGELIFTIS